MSQRASRKARFLREHPLCCFCGGTRSATTLDHVPPKACFPLGFWPEKFEFPACSRCNNGTSRHDTIFGFYSMLLDFNEDNRTRADRERFEKLRDEIARRYSDALPDPASEEPIYRVGHLVTPSPVAISVSTKPAVKEAMNTIGEKLAHALYYREMKKMMTASHAFSASTYQLQRAGTEDLTAFFKRLLPDLTIGGRSNIKKYGNRFAYMSGCKPNEDLFLFAAQFGYGLVCWGMVLGPDMQLNKPSDALQNLNWRSGGSGLGSQPDSCA